jgi:hypothetical protein
MTFLGTKLLKKKIGDKIYNVHHIILEPEPSSTEQNIYQTLDENFILVTENFNGEIILNNATTEHIVVKCLGYVIIKPLKNKIDNEYDEIELGKGSCVEFLLVEDRWYIISSDGLKQS